MHDQTRLYLLHGKAIDRMRRRERATRAERVRYKRISKSARQQATVERARSRYHAAERLQDQARNLVKHLRELL